MTTQGDLHHRRRIGHRPGGRAAVRARGLAGRARRRQRARACARPRRCCPRAWSSTYMMDVRDRDAWAASLDDFTASQRRAARRAVQQCRDRHRRPARRDELRGHRPRRRDQPGRRAQRRADRPCLSRERRRDRACSTPPRASAIYGSSGLAVYSATKFGGARADRGARRRMVTATASRCATLMPELHRHAAARRRRSAARNRIDPRDR